MAGRVHWRRWSSATASSSPTWVTARESFCVVSSATDLSGKLIAEKTNPKLNANSKKEQRRLAAEFPEDKDIYKCKTASQPSTDCYVKGRLQPTHAFGDFFLKHAEFNNPDNLSSKS